jgi:GTPase SAR1 family protein
MSKYQYQIHAADEVLKNAMSSEYRASVLAGCPSSGKSTILIHILNKYFQNNGGQVLVITHNQNILKQQMLENFSKPNVPVNFGFGVHKDAQVIVTTAASAKKYDLSNVGLIVVDEAHEYYLESLYNTIKSKSNAKEILLTGSPSFFNTFNQFTKEKKYGIHYIAGSDLIEHGVFAGVDLLNFVADTASIEVMVESVFKFAKEQGCDLRKPMIAASNIHEAQALKYWLSKRGYKVALSTSMNDNDNKEIEAFKNDEKNCLIVVNKGILGFSEGSITALIDFKGSDDIDVRNQLFARILRKHKEDIRKSYISVCSFLNDAKKDTRMLQELLKLMDRKYFSSYNGKYGKYI